MRTSPRLAVLFATAMLMSACQGEDEPAPSTNAQTEASGTQTVNSELPGDDSEVCPGASICPENYTGVVIPGGITGAPVAGRSRQIVCVVGDPKRPAECPPGLNGRLWEPYNNQTSCYPGTRTADCPADAYAFLCRTNGSNKHCPGIAKMRTGAGPSGGGSGGQGSSGGTTGQ